MKRHPQLLLAIDFSERSTHTLHVGKQLAELMDGIITPFHALVPHPNKTPGSPTGAHQHAPVQQEDLKEKLERMISAHIRPEMLAPARVEEGPVHETLVKTAKDYDFVVIATHGLTHDVRGSVATHLMRFSHTPVFVVTNSERLLPLQRILVTTDFSVHSYQAFGHAKQLAQLSGAAIDLLHITGTGEQEQSLPGRQHLRSMSEARDCLIAVAELYLQDLEQPVTPYVIETVRPIHDEIVVQADRHGYNLVVMATAGRTGVDVLQMGSTASSVALKSPVPLLSINPHNGQLDDCDNTGESS